MLKSIPGLFAGLLSMLVAANAQPVLFSDPLSPRNASYDMDVCLNTQERLLHGYEILTWHNITSDIISELQFHLYLNAFRNNKSTFMRESGGRHRRNKMDQDGWGYIEIDSVGILSGADLTARLTFIQPDDGNPDDRTVARLPLPAPLLPGETIVLHLHFTAKLPKPPFARTGSKEEFFFIGQWFPKVGVYRKGAWNCHQFHANSEFFADFGVYNVRITVPEENIVGATGVEVSITNNGDGTATHFYHAEDVHDFAWTTSPDFLVYTDRAQDVDIRLLLHKDHISQAKRYLQAAKTAVECFQKWYGDYPYPNLTVVDPRRAAFGAGGMEYPTLITGSTYFGIPSGIKLLETVIIHEFGHNYWYGMVASNEFEEAWLDEGINSYCEMEIFHEKYGENGNLVNFLGIKLNNMQMQRAEYIRSPHFDQVVQEAWTYYSTGSYVINSYYKPALLLKTLQNYLGQETMRSILRSYFTRWRFKHPTTEDFIDIASEIAGENLDWFFDQALKSNAVLDYCVSKLYSKQIKEGEGYDFILSMPDTIFMNTDAAFTDDKNMNGMTADSSATDSPKNEDKEDNKPIVYLSEVFVQRKGSFKFPVEVKIVFDNGDTLIENWDGRANWRKFTYERPAKLLWASVDPDYKIALDINYTNNSLTLKKQSMGINKLSIRFLFWMQFLFDILF